MSANPKTECHQATVLPFPAINRVGCVRKAAARIAAADSDERPALFRNELQAASNALRAAGVEAPRAIADDRAFAFALARELSRIGVRGRWEGWLRWPPGRSLPLARWRSAQ